MSGAPESPAHVSFAGPSSRAKQSGRHAGHGDEPRAGFFAERDGVRRRRRRQRETRDARRRFLGDEPRDVPAHVDVGDLRGRRRVAATADFAAPYVAATADFAAPHAEKLQKAVAELIAAIPAKLE